ncbi:hypothetical protein [Neoroseomonas soli]|uniref:Tetratricopeptide repeat protein n=1 Tax=Neoroseomonas soli TaxID=1081025 RepID=A0A9X9WUU8_9PROT|nr:hypothetical protein [Neoroseomonas soli]MBR0670927.1 hypothetical protein [Neoroseomonas soli]
MNMTIVPFPPSGATSAGSPAADQPAWTDDLAHADALFGAGQAEAAMAALRDLPRNLGSRPAAVAATLAAAGRDPEFRALVADADAARDARDFARGELLYWRCLQLYPLHYGYVTQYGHCLKEQGKTAQAEAIYRSALALGGAAEDLHQHIVAVAGARGAAPALLATDAPVADPLDLPPTREDVILLLALLLHRGPASNEETLELLRACPRRRDVALVLIGREEFARANTDLMVLLAEAR